MDRLTIFYIAAVFGAATLVLTGSDLISPADPSISAAKGDTSPSGQVSPKNIILLIADGTGPALFTMARDYVRAVEGREGLVHDSLPRLPTGRRTPPPGPVVGRLPRL